MRKIVDASQGKPLNPEWLANAALLELDPLGQTPALIRAACLRQLRELAEGLLGVAKPPRPAPHADAALLRREAEKGFAHARRLEAWRAGRVTPDESEGPSSA